ncbi:hypothetical protein EK21DRAFT_109447 [Setomelanomma holmii]|uniref:Uncharacterized protein n=1 Tax=Setomelanomma holmii TaxID=210430 RepID=A0A9P4HG52_9PLEO|nr:hypothetical protein EK21DRAFT_109447 [Setomelanomma holmii]
MDKLPESVRDLARMVAEAMSIAFAGQSEPTPSTDEADAQSVDLSDLESEECVDELSMDWPNISSARWEKRLSTKWASSLISPDEVAVPAAPEPCAHEKATSVFARLQNSHQCPVCIILEPINAIQNVQQQLINRGGWSAFKGMGVYHKTLKNKWRKAKIDLTNIVELYETLLSNPEISADDSERLNIALEIYDKKKVALTRVPGLQYVEGAEEEERTEDDSEAATLMVQLLRAVLDEEMEEEDKDYAARWAAFATEEELIKPWRGSENKRKAKVTLRNLQTPQKSDTPMSPSTGSPSTPKSSIKRKSSRSPISSTGKKRVRISLTATVSPAQLNTYDPSSLLLPTPSEPAIKPHSAHSIAEHRRMRGNFWRPSQTYTPGTWASKPNEEKANTHKMYVSWDMVMRQEAKESAKEKENRKKMSSIAKMWVETCEPKRRSDKV